MDFPEIQITEGGRVLSRILCGKGLEGAAEAAVSGGYQSVYIVYDENVSWAASALAGLLSGRGAVVSGMCPVSVSEEKKTFTAVEEICRRMVASGVGRRDLVIAVGGGILTDMAGFAASVYKRGVSCAYVPTTLLAQVDAAIGGKTGVNIDCYKNMMGTVRQPVFTWLCPDVLSTLSLRDFLSGGAELLKTFIISGADHYAEAVSLLSSLNAFSGRDSEGVPSGGSGKGNAGDCPDNQGKRETCLLEWLRDNSHRLSSLVHEAAAVKARIVSEDQFETGLRRVLNLGHTFAHAIEHDEHISSVAAGRPGMSVLSGGGLQAGAQACAAGCEPLLTHGEAVAVGIILAARLSEAVGAAPAGLSGKLRTDFLRCGLPVDCPLPVSSLVEAMSRDKKAEGEDIRFILIRKVGEVAEMSMSAEQAAGYLADV